MITLTPDEEQKVLYDRWQKAMSKLRSAFEGFTRYSADEKYVNNLQNAVWEAHNARMEYEAYLKKLQ